jgi:cell wall-associated NlpC family hydrolase
LAHSSSSRQDRALDDLNRRATHIHASRKRQSVSLSNILGTASKESTQGALKQVPHRLWLHLVMLLIVPLTVVFSSIIPLKPTSVSADSSFSEVSQANLGEAVLSLGPIELESSETEVSYGEDLPVPDSAFSEILSLPEVQAALSRSDMLAPMTVASSVVGEKINLRNGPGQEYDVVTQLAGGTALTLNEVYNDWFVVTTEDGKQGWVAAEVISESETARGVLAVASDIPPPPPPKIASVAEDGLSLRDGPGTNYVKMNSINGGTTIDLLSRFENWFEVRLPSGEIGWVTNEFLQISEGVVERIDVLTSAPDPNPALVAEIDGTINLRGGPGTAYNKLGTIGAGQVVNLIGRYKEWLNVKTNDGKTAWISTEVMPVNSYVLRRVPVAKNIPALPKPATTTSGKPTRANVPSLSPAQSSGVVAFAMQFRGAPYVWGGSRPGAFDCSGFTKYVYAQYGLNLPHSAAGQYSQRYGTFVDKASLQPGDIVFFANTYKRGISHVGIYAGNGMVLQALAPGTPLSSVSMHTPYWSPRYYGALRPNI